MNEIENMNSLNYLNVLYDRLHNSLIEINKKPMKGSVLLAMTKLSSNDRFTVMANSAQRFGKVYNNDLSPLKEKGYIKLSEISSKSNTYVITAMGIYYIEFNKSVIDLNQILQFIQEDSLDFPMSNKPFKDKEKSIIFSLIAFRTFDDKTMMDLNGEVPSAKWTEIIGEQINSFLEKKKVIDASKIFSSKSGHENPISYIVRRLNDLPKKTRNLFTTTNNNQYYLDIDVEDPEEAEDQIAFLLGKIFNNISTIDEAEELKKFLCDIAQSQSIYVLNNFKYINYDWDKLIKRAVDQLFLGIDI